jgi:hypothetical protein
MWSCPLWELVSEGEVRTAKAVWRLACEGRSLVCGFAWCEMGKRELGTYEAVELMEH